MFLWAQKVSAQLKWDHNACLLPSLQRKISPRVFNYLTKKDVPFSCYSVKVCYWFDFVIDQYLLLSSLKLSGEFRSAILLWSAGKWAVSSTNPYPTPFLLPSVQEPSKRMYTSQITVCFHLAQKVLELDSRVYFIPVFWGIPCWAARELFLIIMGYFCCSVLFCFQSISINTPLRLLFFASCIYGFFFVAKIIIGIRSPCV